MEIKNCLNCNKAMYYNNHYHAYECSCGKTYNAFLQELRPIENWAEEYDNEDY